MYIYIYRTVAYIYISKGESYLKNRTQYARLNDVDSDILHMKYGVPQGSVMEPVLVHLYINDIIHASTTLEFVLFADDTYIFYSS